MSDDLDNPGLEVAKAFIEVFQGRPYDLEVLRSGIRGRIEQLEADQELGVWDEYILRSSRQLLPIIDLIEEGEFDAANEALEFAIRW